jgi:hypothetical protein
MHIVAGFIQTLLMLTQAQFVPDMQGFWDAYNKPVTVQQTIHSDAVTTPGTTFVLCEGRVFAVPVNRDAVWVPAALYLPKRYISPVNTFPAGRVITAKKLYLIFCQLRIGEQKAA